VEMSLSRERGGLRVQKGGQTEDESDKQKEM